MGLKASTIQILIFETFAFVEKFLCLWADAHLFGKNTFIFHCVKIKEVIRFISF